jgi:hypothetical protein
MTVCFQNASTTQVLLEQLIKRDCTTDNTEATDRKKSPGAKKPRLMFALRTATVASRLRYGPAS